MKIYTRKGDGGQTGLLGGHHVSKAADRIEAIGEVDELNSLLGCVIAMRPAPSLLECLGYVQDDLFHLGAELASPDPKGAGAARITAEDIERLEAWIDHYDQELEPLRNFVLPGGSQVAAWLFQTRAVARRVERAMVRLACSGEGGDHGASQGIDGLPKSTTEVIRGALLAYLNRLADLLFVMARWQNRHDRAVETPWFPETRGQRAPAERRPPARS
ncbi:MAG: cob(I)yrinic acid a,c-diamide adenosyltransferase [Pirellulaceae bacterium]